MKLSAEQSRKGRATLIYDASCPICSNTVKWISENEQEGAFVLLPCQSESLGSRFPGVGREACMWAMHVVLPDGSVLAGERALPEIFARLKRYRFLSMLLKLPGAAAVSRVAYRWFADRRYRIAAILSHLTRRQKRGHE